MSVFQEPTRSIAIPQRDTVRLWFGDDLPDDTLLTDGGEYYMRGGMAWPMTLNPQHNRVEGFAVVVGRDIRTGIHYVFDETPFVTIDHVVRDGALKYEGLCTWFLNNWRLYHLDTYYFYQPPHTHHKWRHQVDESPLIEPKPSFVEIPWQRHEDAELTIKEMQTRGVLYWYGDEDLHEAVLNHKWQDPATPHCAV